MQKINTFQLRKAIPNEEFDYILLKSALSQYSGIREKIHHLLRSGVIIRVKKGLYVFGSNYNQNFICKEVLANLIYGPSYISLEYALAFYHLIPERVETITSITPKRDKEFRTPLGRFTYKHLGINKYPTGIAQTWIDDNHPVLIATPEKALCDYVVLNKIKHLEHYQDAVDFLEDDMRIDAIHWNRFDLNRFQKINRIYRNKNIDRIQEVLESSQGDKKQ